MGILDSIKLKWQLHNRDNGMSWNEIAELVNEVVHAESTADEIMNEHEIEDYLQKWLYKYGLLNKSYFNYAELYQLVKDMLSDLIKNKPMKDKINELKKQFEDEKQYPSWDCNSTVKNEYIEWLESKLSTPNISAEELFGEVGKILIEQIYKSLTYQEGTYCLLQADVPEVIARAMIMCRQQYTQSQRGECPKCNEKQKYINDLWTAFGNFCKAINETNKPE